MRKATTMLLLVIAALAAGPILAETYEVRVTNLTKGQTFTPVLAVTHKPAIRLFELGEEALPELQVLAESGMTGPLDALLGTIPDLVFDTNTSGGLLEPGDSTRLRIEARGAYRRLSLAGMLIPTNDTFVAVDSVRLPVGNEVARFYAIAYDAGSEENDQDCANIPGPTCMGQGLSPEPAPGDEGYVYVGNGFHELGPQAGKGSNVLGPLNYDWRNPVALVTVRRVAGDDEYSDE